VGDFTGFSHIIFDLDGVLLDTEPLYTRATQQVLAPFNKEFTWATKMQMMGRDPLSSAQHLIDELGLPISGEEYLGRKEPLLEAMFPEAEEIEGASQLVMALAQSSRKLAVATSSSSGHYALKTRRHAWFHAFATVVCSDHPDVRRYKPAPDIFLVAARELGAAPEDCLVIEDSPAGVQAAVAAGMQVLALPDPHVPRSNFRDAKRIIEHYRELDLSD
jgi:pseudouridine-5'-monophosphatase